MIVSFSKLSIKLQFMLSLDIIFIYLNISRINNNNSFAIAIQTIKNKIEYNIIAFAYCDCFLRALESIKNIVKLDPELFLSVDDLSYKKPYYFCFNRNLILDSKTKIDIFAIVKYRNYLIIYLI